MKSKWATWLIRGMAVQCAMASVVYLLNKQWKLGLYWAFATGINAVTSFF